MLMSLVSMLQQQDAIVAQLDRMSTALIVLAWSMGVVGVVSLVAIVVSLYTMRTASRLLATIDEQVKRLAPRTEPLVEKLTRLADDARGVTDLVRRRVTDVMDTVGDLNGTIRDARRETEKRIREFAAVLDVVQTEAEQLLLDAAATARGVQVTAAVLRGAGTRPLGPVRDDLDDMKNDEEADPLDDENTEDDIQAEALSEEDEDTAEAEDFADDVARASVESERRHD